MGREVNNSRPFLLPGEPYMGSFQAFTINEFSKLLTAKPSDAAPLLIAIDGRSAGGKTTLARQLLENFNQTSKIAALLSTDDFAWWHSYFDWDQMLIENAIVPLKAGRAVNYRPDAWVERERKGSITTPEGAQIVVVEGVGIARESLAGYFDHVIWVQSDYQEAHRRGVLRDLTERPDPAEAERFWQEWQAAEDPFQAASKPWSRANFAVLGTATDRENIWLNKMLPR